MPTRRSPGEGSISQRSDGRWQASLQVDGIRKTVYGKTRREVHAKLVELKRQAAVSGSLPDAGSRTTGDLLDSWLDTTAPNLKQTTLAHYRLLCDTYLRPCLGSVRLDRLTPVRIQQLYSGLQKKGHNRTARLVHCVLHQACELGVLWRRLPSNPTEHTVRPKYKAERKEVWMPDELATFLEGAQGHWLRPLWVLGIASGCRLGELLGLTWLDVGDDGEAIQVVRTLHRVEGEYRVGTTKTSASDRRVSLPSEGVAALLAQKQQQAKWWAEVGDDWEHWGLVFTGKTGRPLHRSVVAHALKRECRRLGIREVTPHGLRHLHASLLLAEGLPVPAVSARLGHANPSITMAVYAHAIGTEDKVAAEAIGRAMGARQKPRAEP